MTYPYFGRSVDKLNVDRQFTVLYVHIGTSVCSHWDIRDSSICYRTRIFLFRGPFIYEIGFSGILHFFEIFILILVISGFQALNLFMTALGAWSTIPVVLMVNTFPNDPWLPENLDDGNLSYYFLVLGAIMLLDLVIGDIL